MDTRVSDRPAQPLILPDRRLSRGHHQPANRQPWHPVSNPFGVAGVLIPGPEQAAQR